jgi:hypothetical protein
MKKKIKGKERKDVRRSSSFFPSKTKKKIKNKKTKHKGKRKKDCTSSSTFSCVRPSSTFLKQT